MSNRLLDATWTYHDGTKHSPQSVRTGARPLDWENQPLPYKIYSTLEPLLLPQDLTLPRRWALGAIAVTGAEQARAEQAGTQQPGVVSPGGSPSGARVPDLGTLAGILFLSAGITNRLTFPGRGTMDFRAAACTGALYHIELYPICGDLPGLPAGVYHLGVHDFSLRRLRAGDFRGALVRASGGEPSIASAPVIVVCTTTFWRNAWKYRARAYRHAFWDCGTILANMLAASVGSDLPARVVCGFADAEVNRLLDLDTQREVAIALVALGWDGAPAPAATPELMPLNLPMVPLSKREVDYPAIRAMHAASSLESAEEAAAWHVQASVAAPASGMVAPGPTGRLFPLRPLEGSDIPRGSIARVIIRRGSSRRFAREPITFAQLSTILDRATRGIPADFLTLNDLYLIVHAVDGLPPGTYVFHRARRALELLREGAFRREAGFLGLEQELPADASVNVYFLAHLPPILGRFGNRGYRAAQLEAAITGGKLYLAAYALRLGATGLTFYDDEVTRFFSPHAAGRSVMFLTALGVPAKRRTR